MAAAQPGAALGASNPILVAWIATVFGFLTAPDSLSFTIYDVTTEERELSPAAVFGPHAVDLIADRVQAGCYAAAWTVPSNEALGRHRISWTATVTSTDQDGNATSRTLAWSRDFDVLASLTVAQAGYALVSDMRSEGFTEQRVSDAVMVKKIRDASATFDRLTGMRWFVARYHTWRVDGTWKPVLMLDHPVAAIDSATVFGEGLIASDQYKVFNRHLSGLLVPDDRDNPKLEFFITQPGLQGPVQPLAYPYPISAAWLTPKVWAKGTQNVTLAGLFGYTDPDGSCEGMTPSEVTLATKLLVVRSLPRLSKTNDVFDARHRHRIKSEKTREQSYDLVDGGAGKGWATSDIEIDRIIERYSRPPRMSAV